jgi:hypothetical protein
LYECGDSGCVVEGLFESIGEHRGFNQVHVSCGEDVDSFIKYCKTKIE